MTWQHPESANLDIECPSCILLRSRNHLLGRSLSECIYRDAFISMHHKSTCQRSHAKLHGLHAQCRDGTLLCTIFPICLTLSGVPELTCTQQVVFSQSLRLKGGLDTRSDVSSHSCSPLIHSQCTSALRLSASLPRMSAPLHLQDPSLAPRFSVPLSSVGSIRNWAGHINRRRTPSSPPVSRAD